MTRQKKSRKQKAIKVSPTATEKNISTNAKDKRIRKKVGNKPGTRQQVRAGNQKNAKTEVKDPRLGSKKPIALVPSQKTDTNALPKKAKQSSSIPAVRVLQSEPSIQQQINAIEQDEKLLAIIEKQEQEIELSDVDVDYFNTLMDKHEQLTALLPQEPELISDAFEKNEDLSEDDLWHKFNNTDFTDENL